MLEILIITVFVLGYTAIALEHPLKVNKSATALIIAVLCWTLYAIGGSHNIETTTHHLLEHLSDVAQILFFLIGAMTIVEIVDSHKGFKVVTDLIKTDSKRKLLWIISFITFFLSAILDNLTTSIVMVSLLRKLITDRHDRMIIASIIIIAANAGGAWSPIGDVTTTMLWIGGQVTTVNIIKMLIVPSLFALIIPLIYESFFVKGKFESPKMESEITKSEPASKLMFFLGVGALIFVPIFKTVTHLPPYMGMMFGLGIVWLTTDFLHHKHEDRHHLTVPHALGRIDVSSILFFLGILLAVGALQTAGLLKALSTWLDKTIGNEDIIVTMLGILSAIIDNVPLTAAAMGMYDLAVYPSDSKIWEMLAFAVGTGGSALIIGSAAGVVVMGMEKIDFIWYLKKITFTALLGYFAGIFAYLVIFNLTH
jgi:NhaD family Na+/H+ antiporter